jgi:hypothetical protein
MWDRGRVFDLNDGEKRRTEAILLSANTGLVAIDFHGFLVSPDGRLLARGYAHDGNLFRLRRLLAEGLPDDAGAPSALAHIKLGHSLVCPALVEVRGLMDWLGRCSHYLSLRQVFDDVFTPAGRIALARGHLDGAPRG